MRRLAEGVWQLRGLPPDAINSYLVLGRGSDPFPTLVDAGTRWAVGRIRRQTRWVPLAAHVLTHAHPDHQGASHAICTEREIPLWCGEGDADAMETPGGIARSQPPGLVNRLQERLWTGPPHPVARRLREGDEVAGFEVLEVPGHSPGHVAFWRASDGVLVAGDVMNNMDVRTGVPGLREPLPVFTPDPARNRESIRRLAALRPSLVLFGHGPPLRDWRKLDRFVENLA